MDCSIALEFGYMSNHGTSVLFNGSGASSVAVNVCVCFIYLFLLV